MNIILVGYMYSGKTTVGRKLASRLNLDFYDLDQHFELKYKISVRDFFEKYDEKAFREIEHRLLIEVLQKDNIVLSTGGGTPCFYDNIDIINSQGISVYLKMDPKSILHRAVHSKNPRPLFQNIKEDELPDFILRHLEEREKYYNKAHLLFKGENADVDLLARSILDLM